MNDLMAMLARWDEAVAQRPGHAMAWNNRGVALYQLGRAEEAVASFSRGLALDRSQAGFWFNRGMVAGLDLRDYAQAIPDLERAIALAPDYTFAHWLLLRFRLHACDWRDYDALVARLKAEVAAGKTMVDPLLFLTVSQSPAEHRVCAGSYGNHEYPPQPPLWRPRAHDRIRLGYMSGDFYDHATAHLMVELFERHDRSRFEVFAVDISRPDRSAMRQRLEKAFDRMVPIRDLPSDAAARLVADEEIDILININGYAGNHRMMVSAYRPAPIQVNYLGYPGTFGLPYMDYIVADPVVIPRGEEQHYAERVVTLPDCYQVNDRQRPIAPAPGREACGLPQDGIVFCNFNSTHKLTPEIFAVWMRILAAIPGSVLWQLQGNNLVPDNLRRAAAAAGVAPDRLIFAPNLPLEQHLGRLRLADLCLDTLPYNAHTTASDALWAGVPMVTLRGAAFPGRVAASLLTSVGLPELITENIADYEALILALGREPSRLAQLREKLAVNRLTTPLFDSARFTRHLEAAFTAMWERYLQGLPPQGFAVEAVS